MSFLSRVTAAPILTNDMVGRRGFFDTQAGLGLGGHVFDTGEHLGAAALSGWLNAKHGDHPWMQVKGMETTYVAGWGLKALAVIADLLGFGDGWSSHVNALATGTLSAHYAARAASAGTPDHVKTALKTAAAAPALPPKTTAVGAIPPAPQPGKWLDLNRANKIAAMAG